MVVLSWLLIAEGIALGFVVVIWFVNSKAGNIVIMIVVVGDGDGDGDDMVICVDVDVNVYLMNACCVRFEVVVLAHVVDDVVVSSLLFVCLFVCVCLCLFV